MWITTLTGDYIRANLVLRFWINDGDSTLYKVVAETEDGHYPVFKTGLQEGEEFAIGMRERCEKHIESLLAKIEPQPRQTVEICRSWSFKLNTGNYQSEDFFCSQKAECFESEVEEKSTALYLFCKTEVIKAVNARCKELGKPLEFPLPKKAKNDG